MVVQVDKPGEDYVVGIDQDGILLAGGSLRDCGDFVLLDYHPSLAENLFGSNDSTADHDCSVLGCCRTRKECDEGDNCKPPIPDVNHDCTSISLQEWTRLDTALEAGFGECAEKDSREFSLDEKR